MKGFRCCGVCTFVRVNLVLDVEVDADYEGVGQKVGAAHAHDHVGVVEGDLLGGLHHE